MPITDGARIFALATGVAATNTLSACARRGPACGIAAADLRDWFDAFEYLQLLRLRTQHRRFAGELPPSANANLVPLASLSAPRPARAQGSAAAGAQAAAAPGAGLSMSVRRRTARTAGSRCCGGARRRSAGSCSTPRPPASIRSATRCWRSAPWPWTTQGIRLGDSFEVVLQTRRAGRRRQRRRARHRPRRRSAAGVAGGQRVAVVRDLRRRCALHRVSRRVRPGGARRAFAAAGVRVDCRRNGSISAAGGHARPCPGTSAARAASTTGSRVFAHRDASATTAAVDALATAELLLRLRALAAAQGVAVSTLSRAAGSAGGSAPANERSRLCLGEPAATILPFVTGRTPMGFSFAGKFPAQAPAPDAARRLLAPDDARDAPRPRRLHLSGVRAGRQRARGAGGVAAGRVAQERRPAVPRRRAVPGARRSRHGVVPGRARTNSSRSTPPRRGIRRDSCRARCAR